MRKIIIAGSEGLIGEKTSSDFELMEDVECVKFDKVLGVDLSKEKELIELMKKHSDASYLINLFAINDHVETNKPDQDLFEISLESIRKYCEVNLVTLFSVCRSFAKHCDNPKGIINFSSLYGSVSPKKSIYSAGEKHIGYTITKHGVVGLTRHLATHLAPVRVNCLIPGGVLHKQDDSFIKNYSNHTPLNRMMQPEELTGILNLLCSENSTYITGAKIAVDGGWTAW